MLNDDKNFWTALLWFAYFLFLELASLGQTSEISPCIIISQEQHSEYNSGYQACASVHEAVFRFMGFIYDNAGHDNIIAFGTIVIAFFTLALWWSTSRLWKAGEIHSERELRAYVVVENITITNVRVGGTPEAEIIIKNSGQTPAYEIDPNIAIGLIRYPPQSTPDLSDGDTPKSLSVLGPKGKHRIRAPLSGVMSSAQFNGVSDGSRAIHIFGSISYRDAFGKTRITKFNAFYGGEFGVDPSGSPFHASHGNEAT